MMEIQQLNYEIRNKAIGRVPQRDIEKLSVSWFNKDLSYSGVSDTMYMILPTPGCSWALGDSGGCTMCSYISDSPMVKIDSKKLFELFKEEFEKYELTDYTVIKIFVSGSFLNPLELDIESRDKILKYLSENEHIKEIVVESRPEYIKKEDLEDIFSIIGNKLFEISIGLESADNFTRDIKINKGFTKKDFEDGIGILKGLKDKHDIKSKAYILVKPILTNEKEAIDDAIKTAIYCDKIGVDRLSFTPVTVHRGTLLEFLWKRKAYQPSWIWSCVEIINNIRENITIPSLMDTSGFGSRRGPYNCKKCNKDLKHLIINSNLKQSQIEYECNCKNEWYGIIENADLNKSKTFIKHLPLV
jgi:radical SAM enzyme (TIGR01210 family)